MWYVSFMEVSEQIKIQVLDVCYTIDIKWIAIQLTEYEK